MRKRRNNVIQLTILAALGISVILTMAIPQLAHGRRYAQLLELSVLIRESDSALWSNTRLGMEQAANDLGAELRFLTLSPPNDGPSQEALIRREAEGGADVLIAVPADSAALSVHWKELAGQCPLVTMESSVEGEAACIAPDHEALGQSLAQAAAEDWQGGTVLLLDTAEKSAGISARLESARQFLAQQGIPFYTWRVPSDFSAEELAALVQEEGARSAMAFEPSATEHLSAAKESGALPLALYGVGGTAGITASLERGTLAAVAAWSDYAAGYLAVEGAVSAAQGKSPSSAPLAFFILRGEDIYEPEYQKLLFPVTS